MPRRTHRRQPGGHSRAHIIEQRERWRSRRAGYDIRPPRALERDPDRYGSVLCLEPGQLRRELAVRAVFDELRRYGQIGPEWHLPVSMILSMPRDVREFFTWKGTRYMDQLDQGWMLDRWWWDDDPLPRDPHHPSHRAYSKQRWRREMADDLTGVTASPQHPRHPDGSRHKHRYRWLRNERNSRMWWGGPTRSVTDWTGVCLVCGKSKRSLTEPPDRYIVASEREMPRTSWQRRDDARRLGADAAEAKDRFSSQAIWTRLYGDAAAQMLGQLSGYDLMMVLGGTGPGLRSPEPEEVPMP